MHTHAGSSRPEATQLGTAAAAGVSVSGAPVSVVTAEGFINRLYAPLAWEGTLAIGDPALASRIVERALREAWEGRERFASSEALFLQSRDVARQELRREAERRRRLTSLDDSAPSGTTHLGMLEMMSVSAVLQRLVSIGDATSASPGAVRGAPDDAPMVSAAPERQPPATTSASPAPERLSPATTSTLSAPALSAPALSAPPPQARATSPSTAHPIAQSAPRPELRGTSAPARSALADTAMFATLATLPPTHTPERSPTAGDAARTHSTASRPRVASAFNGRRAAAGAAQPALHFADRIRAAEAPRISPRVIGIAAAATIAVLLLGWLIFGRPDAEALALTALGAELGDPTSTTSGQRALVTLADGSIVRLGANATVRSSVSYGDGARAVVLQGPVSVSLGSGNEQPVAIATGAHQWVTTGAVATFGQAGDHTLVVVDSGAIELVLEDKRERLESGQAVRVSTSGALEPLDDATRATEFAWRDGRFVARAVALRDLRSPLLQWFDRELKLADGIAPDMAVSLDVPLDATDSLSAALARETGLNVAEEGRELRVVTPPPQAASPAPVARRPRRDLFLPPPSLPEPRGGSGLPF